MICIGPSEPFRITVEKDIPHCDVSEAGILAGKEFSPKIKPDVSNADVLSK